MILTHMFGWYLFLCSAQFSAESCMCEAWHACQEVFFFFPLLLCVCTWFGGTFSGGEKMGRSLQGRMNSNTQHVGSWSAGCGLYNSTNQCWLVCGC